ncbi:hypothetical protein GCM10012275_56820 [Longimycelium tulufanense]|uniref:MFS transporter n=1 Tax=Longimycelium tulufanense TaxID=907463 RepID=A0A8J3FXD9_9PSEU|nr:MFS transporter [Longimycelium tulufanense]GGM78818.1 hypothetical protein GCM10012275_56820 [Longimycelium tulufanense]
MNAAEPGGPHRGSGFAAFSVIWFGQTLSLLASGMTNFALTLWLWQRSERALPITILELCSYAAVVALSPVAGVLADRWGRRRTLATSNIAAAGVITLLWLLNALGMLGEAWIYPGMIALGGCLALQYPALTAAVTSLVAARDYARASGMLSLSVSMAGVVAPVVAALLMTNGGLGAVLVIDIISYLIAVTTLVVPIPQPPGRAANRRHRLRADLTFGFRYIARRPGFLALQIAFFLFYFASMFGVLLGPLVLARTQGDASALAGVLSAAGIGGILGGLATTAWGGAGIRPLTVILGGFVLTGLAGQLPFGISDTTAIWWVGSFAGAFLFPAIQAANQTIWQTMVPALVQGRVFAARRVLTESAGPIAMLLAGPLADDVFEPAMHHGPLVSALSWLVGTGPGAGTALIFVLAALLSIATGLWGLRARGLRELAALCARHEEATTSAIAGEARHGG